MERTVQTVIGALPVAQAVAIEVERKAVEITAAKNMQQAQMIFERARGWLDALVWLGEVSIEARDGYLLDVLGPVLFKRLNLTIKCTRLGLGL